MRCKCTEVPVLQGKIGLARSDMAAATGVVAEDLAAAIWVVGGDGHAGRSQREEIVWKNRLTASVADGMEPTTSRIAQITAVKRGHTSPGNTPPQGAHRRKRVQVYANQIQVLARRDPEGGGTDESHGDAHSDSRFLNLEHIFSRLPKIR
jgi:hypothetical protein